MLRRILTIQPVLFVLLFFERTIGTENFSLRRKDHSLSQRELDVRIVGGEAVERGAYESFVVTASSQLCGGTVIHPDIVLTAAHCVGAFLNGVLHGGILIDGSDSTSYIPVDEELPHPNYSNETNANDIMLVKLSMISTIPIQRLNYNNNIPADNQLVTVIGYGRLSDGGAFPESLQKVDINIVNFDECDSIYNRLIEPIMLCAGQDGRDACQGDSGGPLFTQGNVQVGIVSFGAGCGENPGVYARVSGFESWIREGICDLSDDPPDSCAPTASPVDQGQNPPCYICFDNGMSTVTNLDTVIDLPAFVGIPSATCEQIQMAAEVQFLIPEQFCPQLDLPELREACGCENVLTASPTASQATTTAPSMQSGQTSYPTGSVNPPCYICFDDGVSTITNPDALFMLGDTASTCEDIRIGAEVQRLIPAQFCDQLDLIELRVTCGCENVLTEAPSPQIGTAIPTGGPVATVLPTATQPGTTSPVATVSPTNAQPDTPSSVATLAPTNAQPDTPSPITTIAPTIGTSSPMATMAPTAIPVMTSTPVTTLAPTSKQSITLSPLMTPAPTRGQVVTTSPAITTVPTGGAVTNSPADFPLSITAVPTLSPTMSSTNTPVITASPSSIQQSALPETAIPTVDIPVSQPTVIPTIFATSVRDRPTVTPGSVPTSPPPFVAETPLPTLEPTKMTIIRPDRKPKPFPQFEKRIPHRYPHSKRKKGKKKKKRKKHKKKKKSGKGTKHVHKQGKSGKGGDGGTGLLLQPVKDQRKYYGYEIHHNAVHSVFEESTTTLPKVETFDSLLGRSEETTSHNLLGWLNG